LKSTSPLNPEMIRERCVKNILDLVILKAVDGGSKCGYDIIGHVHNTFHVLLSPGTVYPLLEAMAQQNILQSALKGKKRFYTLTKEGKELVKAVTSEYMKVHSILNLDTGEAGG